MNAMTFEIRKATVADAEGIAFVHVKAWQESYGYALPQTELDAMNPADRVERWRNILNGAEQQAYVAVNDAHQIVGWATAGSCRDEDRPGEFELYAIYLLAAAHGSGAGQALLDAAIGNQAASLWMMAGNKRAERFYLKNGFVPDGVTRNEEIWGVTVNEIRMQRPEIRSGQ